MSGNKGKGRALPSKDREGEEKDDPSLISRVAASASGLTRSAFATPASSELSDSAAYVLASSGKSQSYTAVERGGTAWAESSNSPHNPSYPQNSTSIALRTRDEEEHVRLSENEFSSFLDGVDSLQSPEGIRDGISMGSSEGRRFQEAWARSQPGPRNGGVASKPKDRSVTEQESRDGEEVLDILSGPDIAEERFAEPPEDDNNYDWGLSEEQLSRLRAMTKDILPPPTTYTGALPEHPLNLNTSFEGDSLDDREHWRDQWDGVLTRYADEVWGGLLPLVKEARREVEEMQSRGSDEQPKALRRLGAILGHLQKR